MDSLFYFLDLLHVLKYQLRECTDATRVTLVRCIHKHTSPNPNYASITQNDGMQNGIASDRKRHYQQHNLWFDFFVGPLMAVNQYGLKRYT